MTKKKLFNKKNSYFKIFIYLFIFSLIAIIFFYFYFINSKDFFSIAKNYDSYYIIPDDKEGKTIDNQEKKTLNLAYTNKDNINIINDPNLEYSIQLYASDNYKFIINYRNKLIKKGDSIFLPENLLVAILNYELTSEYLLLFKNFSTRKNAFEYCKKYSYYLDKCIIVNVQNLD